MPVFTIHHITKYEYDRLVKESINEIKIYPYQCNTQEVLQHDVNITGNPTVHTYIDYWGNKTGTFSLAASHKDFVIESKLIIRTIGNTELQINRDASWQLLNEERDESLQLIELSSAESIQKQTVIDEMIATLHIENSSIATITEQCCELIFKNFTYKKGITDTETTVDEILEVKAGVCQDFAHLMLQILRTIKVPCRYVSGYICPNKNGMRGEGATHAWVEVYIPTTGWVGIDPTNNVWVTNNHVKLAVGKNFTDCTPIKGTFKGPAKQRLSVYVSIGYEDGHMFEDVNDVSLQAEQNVDMIQAIIAYDIEQQQQQQQ